MSKNGNGNGFAALTPDQVYVKEGIPTQSVKDISAALGIRNIDGAGLSAIKAFYAKSKSDGQTIKQAIAAYHQSQFQSQPAAPVPSSDQEGQPTVNSSGQNDRVGYESSHAANTACAVADQGSAELLVLRHVEQTVGDIAQYENDLAQQSEMLVENLSDRLASHLDGRLLMAKVVTRTAEKVKNGSQGGLSTNPFSQVTAALNPPLYNRYLPLLGNDTVALPPSSVQQETSQL